MKWKLVLLVLSVGLVTGTILILAVYRDSVLRSNKVCEQNFAQLIENEGISVTLADPDAGQFELGEVIVLAVENTSGFNIWFPSDGHIFIYEVDTCGNVIEEVEDRINRTHSREMLLESGGGVDSFGIVEILPSFAATSDADLLVRIVGYVYENGLATEHLLSGSVIIPLHVE